MSVWLTWLADVSRAAGLVVTEDGGWKTRGHGPMAMCEGIVGHHTAGPATGNYPSLAVVRNGRADLAGPLANLGLARDGTVYTIAAGCAWHAGVSSHAGFTSLNDKYIGIEAESTGLGNGDWTPAQLLAYPKLCAALLKHMGRGSDRYASHRLVALPAGRKIDPTGISDTWMRGAIDAIWRGPVTPPPAGTPWLALPTLTYQQSGAGVMALQKWLVKMFPSYAHFTPTGFYGPDTKATIAQFQKRVGITGADADGATVGPKTKKALWDQGFRG